MCALAYLPSPAYFWQALRTATGKVITVELDGLPGENKRPKDSAKIKERLDQYDEKVVPIAYEEPKEYIFPSTDLLTPSPAYFWQALRDLYLMQFPA